MTKITMKLFFLRCISSSEKRCFHIIKLQQLVLRQFFTANSVLRRRGIMKALTYGGPCSQQEIAKTTPTVCLSPVYRNTRKVLAYRWCKISTTDTEMLYWTTGIFVLYTVASWPSALEPIANCYTSHQCQHIRLFQTSTEDAPNPMSGNLTAHDSSSEELFWRGAMSKSMTLTLTSCSVFALSALCCCAIKGQL